MEVIDYKCSRLVKMWADFFGAFSFKPPGGLFRA